MKILLKFYPAILIIIFILSCNFSAKLSNPLINSYYTYPINESPYPKSFMQIAAFSSEKAYLTDLESIEEFKAAHSNASFFLPRDKEDFFKEKFSEAVKNDNEKNSSNIIVEQITEDKQRIEVHIVGSKSSGITKYEATDREIFPLTYAELNLGSAFYLVLTSLICGGLGCVIFNYFFKKFINAKAA